MVICSLSLVSFGHYFLSWNLRQQYFVFCQQHGLSLTPDPAAPLYLTSTHTQQWRGHLIWFPTVSCHPQVDMSFLYFILKGLGSPLSHKSFVLCLTVGNERKAAEQSRLWGGKKSFRGHLILKRKTIEKTRAATVHISDQSTVKVLPL